MTVVAHPRVQFGDLRVDRLRLGDASVQQATWYPFLRHCLDTGLGTATALSVSDRQEPTRAVVLLLLSLPGDYTASGALTRTRQDPLLCPVLDSLEREIWYTQQVDRFEGLAGESVSMEDIEAFRSRARGADFRAWVSPDEFLFVVHDVVGQDEGVFAVDCVSRHPRRYWGMKGDIDKDRPLVVSVLTRAQAGAACHAMGVDDYFLPVGVWLCKTLGVPAGRGPLGGAQAGSP
jgi:hypothetical protein